MQTKWLWIKPCQYWIISVSFPNSYLLFVFSYLVLQLLSRENQQISQWDASGANEFVRIGSKNTDKCWTNSSSYCCTFKEAVASCFVIHNIILGNKNSALCAYKILLPWKQIKNHGWHSLSLVSVDFSRSIHHCFLTMYCGATAVITLQLIVHPFWQHKRTVIMWLNLQKRDHWLLYTTL